MFMFWHYCVEKVEFKRRIKKSIHVIKEEYENKIIVLKKNLDEKSALQIIDDKKTGIFRSLLRKPKKGDVDVLPLKLLYEAILLVSGKYSANFYRKAIHTIVVDHNIKEVVLGDGIFPVKVKSKFQKTVRKTGKNKVDLQLDEHVFIEDEDALYFDNHGKELRLPFKLNSKTMENYPKKILIKNEQNVKKPEITYDAVINKISTKLKQSLESNIRDLKDELIINEISEIYVPIYEARLVGPKGKAGILRIDAVRKKIL